VVAGRFFRVWRVGLPAKAGVSTAAPTGVVTLLEASMEQCKPSFSALSRGNPRSGFSDRRWRRYGVVFPLEGFAS
jgi:hypothetical protein